jgi:hypothetical protein
LFSSILAVSKARNPTKKWTRKIYRKSTENLNNNQHTVDQARLLFKVIGKTVNKMNFAIAVARQIRNLATRMIFKTSVLNDETKKMFWRNMNPENRKNGACKTHQWFLKLTMVLPSILSISAPLADNVPQPSAHSTLSSASISSVANTNSDLVHDPFYGFSPDGTITDRQALKVAASDPILQDCLFLLNNVPLGNIILAARELWHS